MAEKDKYIVEVIEAICGGDDYTENDYEFDTAGEVRDFIRNDLSQDESVHSVLFYKAGTNSNPKDVTRKF